MSFDTYATKNGEVVWLLESAGSVSSPSATESESIQRAFAKADEKLQEITGWSGLWDANINCKQEWMRATALTGFKSYDPDNKVGTIDWTPLQVQFVQQVAKWDFEPPRDQDNGLEFYF